MCCCVSVVVECFAVCCGSTGIPFAISGDPQPFRCTYGKSSEGSHETTEDELFKQCSLLSSTGYNPAMIDSASSLTSIFLVGDSDSRSQTAKTLLSSKKSGSSSEERTAS